MNYYFSVILSFLAAFQLFFVALFLFSHKRGNKRNNRLLGLVFLLFSITMGDFTIRVSGIEIPILALHMIDDGFFFLYGPLLYFYVKGVVYSDFKFRVTDLFHLIPYTLYVAYLIELIFFLNLEDQTQVTRKILTSDLPSWMYLASILIYIYIFSYLWFCQRTVTFYRSIIKDKFSSIDGINLDWLSFIIRSFTILTIISMIHNVSPAFGSAFFHYTSLIVLLIFTFLFVNRVLVKALNQPEIFSGIELKELEKYSGSNLNADEINNYNAQLIVVLEKERLYLNPVLTINDLAEHLQTTSKVLSQVINQSFNKKFYDFINSYRCEEVKNILKGPDDKITILEAMYQSGFTSKSSFNKEFKKLTGQTPTEFKKSISK